MKELRLLFLLVLLAFVASAQTKPSPKIDTVWVAKGLLVVLPDTSFIVGQDTIIIGEKVRVREDPYSKSEKFYDSLQEKASRTKVGRELHELIIREEHTPRRVDSVIVRSEDTYRDYTGKRIRTVIILKTDLLEGSVLDTTLHATSKIGKMVNRLHVDTRDFIIRNNLLFREGDVVDPYKLADNERLLRQFKTIRDARIYLRPSPDYADEVDVVVVTQDVASVGASGGYSSINKFNFDVYDINILGYAKQFQVSYFRNTRGVPQNGYELLLREPNFGHSFIHGELRYTDNYIRNRLGLTLGRDFLTPRMKYAGGLDAYSTNEKVLISRNDTLPIPYRQNGVDAWLGRSIPVNTRTNVVVAVRATGYDFTSRPEISVDSNYFFYNRKSLLAGITLFETNYIKGSLIQGFGRTEDVPVNSWMGLTVGPEQNDFNTRTYVDWHAGIGRYYSRRGYFYGDATVSAFRNHSIWEDGLVEVNFRYFSNLMNAGKTKVRQFLNASYINGYRRTTYQTIAIDRGWKDSRGFVPVGSTRATIGIETVYFTPWYYYGFRVALYHGVDFHVLSSSATAPRGNEMFPAIRGGFRMLNDNLVFPTLSLDVEYFMKTHGYPSAFRINVSTSLPRLFGAPHNFKPQVSAFQ